MTMRVGLMLLVCLGPWHHVLAETAVEPFALRDVTLLDGPFKQAQEIDRQYILAHDPNRLLAPFLKEAGLPPKADVYPDWEAGGLAGHIGGHYLTALAQMAATTGDPAISRRLDFMIGELARCQEKHGDGYVGGVPNGRELWQEIAAGDIKAENFNLNGRWVPLYNLHKLWAGLRDAYRIAGVLPAREMLVKLTDWWIGVTGDLSDQQIQSMLRSEHGGLNEVFADVYAITGEERYLTLARRFSHRQILDPLIEQQDRLTGLHANTQIPKVVGFERIGQLCDEPSYHQAARFFWEAVTRRRTVAFGGNSVREHFNPVDDFQELLEHRQGPETCNTYNMLRLSELLFYTRPEARYADYYERGLFNHILSSQHSTRPGFVYFTPLRPCHYRVYSQPEIHFWCCVGSGMENHGKYGQFIYARSDEALYVNLFMASEVIWRAKGVTVRQETAFPDEARTRLTISVAEPTPLTLRIRYPAWVAPGKLAIKINDRPVVITNAPGSYVPLQRTWRQGDRVDIDLPMQTTLERLGGDSDYAALVHGPIVLAAPTSQDRLDGLFAGEGRWVHIPNGPLVPLNQAPMLVCDDPQSIPTHLRPVPGKPLTFSAASVIQPHAFADRELIPFFRVHESRYMIYWRLATPHEYEAVVRGLQAEEKAKMVLAQNTLDLVIAGEQQPEMDHHYQAEQTDVGEHEGRHWRDSRAWFSYELKTQANVGVELMVTYAVSAESRRFDILVNGRHIAAVDRLPTGGEPFVVARYPIETSILEQASDGRLTVRFLARDNARTARVCEVRLVKARAEAR